MDIILNTFGTYLTKDNNTFLVVHKDGKQRIDPEKVKSISISKGAQISSDAAIMAIEHQIDVQFVNAVGTPVGRIWSNRYGSISTIRKHQVDFAFSADAVEWIKDIIIRKIDNQTALLLSFAPDGIVDEKKVEKCISKLEDYKTKIKILDGNVVVDIAPTLRGWEGVSSKNYFSTLNLFLPEKYKFSERSQHPAKDIANCMLNYGYGILYGKIESALIKAGIDPYMGIFHRDDYNRPVLVYDVIELFRIWVDYVVVNLLIQSVINEDCYSINDDGSYWLEALGKRILIQGLNDYLDEIINIKTKERSRLTHLTLYTQKLAKTFLNYKPKH